MSLAHRPGAESGYNAFMSGEKATPSEVKNELLAALAERDAMLADLYDELRAAAARLLRREAPDLTLQPTELVNEAALRVMKLDRMSFVDRRHFFATGARILRQAMIDALRRRRSAKRRMPTLFLSGDEDETVADLDALDEALGRLEAAAPDLAQIVELRFFVGLGIAEVAAVTQMSESSVKRRWQTARIWLAGELGGGPASGGAPIS